MPYDQNAGSTRGVVEWKYMSVKAAQAASDSAYLALNKEEQFPSFNVDPEECFYFSKIEVYKNENVIKENEQQANAPVTIETTASSVKFKTLVSQLNVDETFKVKVTEGDQSKDASVRVITCNEQFEASKASQTINLPRGTGSQEYVWKYTWDESFNSDIEYKDLLVEQKLPYFKHKGTNAKKECIAETIVAYSNSALTTLWTAGASSI